MKKHILCAMLAVGLIAAPAFAQFTPGPGGGGSGTVTSVGLAMPTMFTVSGSPVITSGTLTVSLASQTANLFLASPNGSSGLPTFRQIAGVDLPAPGVSSLGAVFSASAPANQFMTGIGLTGALTFAQPSFSNLSGNVLPSQFASQTANTVLAAPNGSAGVPTFRNSVGADFGSQAANTFLAAPNGSAGNPVFRTLAGADVPFTQNGTGAVTTNIRVKAAQIVSVQDFMTAAQIADASACTYTLDQAPAITAAIASMGSVGGTVTFGNGCFLLNSSINMHGTNVFLQGNGYATILKASGNFPVISSPGTFAAQDNNIGVRNFQIVCGGLANTSAHGISWTYTNTGLIENIYFKGCRHGLDLYDQWQTVVNNIRVNGAGADQSYDGVYLGAPTDPANTVPNNAVKMTNITVQGVSNIGFEMPFFAGSVGVNLEAQNGGHGFELCNAAYIIAAQPCQFGHFANVLADTTSAEGIRVMQGANTNAVNNLMFDNVWIGNSNAYGLFLNGVTNSAFKAVHVAAGDNGIGVQNSTFVTIDGDMNTINRNNNGSYYLALNGVNNSTFNLQNLQSANPLSGVGGMNFAGTNNANDIYTPKMLGTVGLAFGGGSTGITYSSNSAYFQFRGRVIDWQYFLSLTAKGSSTGAATLTGLPYVAANDANYKFGAVGTAWGASNMAALGGAILMEAVPGATTVNLATQGATSVGNLTDANFTATSTLTGRLSYFIF